MFIIADEVTLLQNSNIGNSIQFKNFKFKYSENSFGVDAGHLGLNYKESDTNILFQLFNLINEKKVFISPSNNNIYVSLELMNSIVDYYFPSEFLTDEKCKNIVDSDSNVIECNINSIDISKLNAITFIVHDIASHRIIFTPNN